jgi:outer membrane immunogenic protein
MKRARLYRRLTKRLTHIRRTSRKLGECPLLTQSRHGRVDLQGTSTVSGIVHAEATIPPFSITHVIGHSHVNTGWTVGYGTEGKLLIPGWTLKAEYLYVDLGTLDDNDPPPPTTISVLGGGQTFTHTHFTDNIIRVGLNYQFH